MTQLGMDEKELEVYLQLLKLGPVRATAVARRLKLPRTTVINVLTRLEEANMVTRSIHKNAFIFAPIHPENLPSIVEMQRRRKDQELNKLIDDLHKLTPELTGMMHSSKSLPSVKFYQGKEAARTVLFDTLSSKTELKDFANIDAMFRHIEDINNEYVAEREKTSIVKRSLILDTPFARQVYEGGKYSSKSHRGYKWIDRNLYPFTLEMNIYDGKVSYLTYVENDFVGVIIENEHIYQMHDSVWNLLWDTLPKPKRKN